MDQKEYKKIRVEELRGLVASFSDEYLNPELKVYCLNLINILAQKKLCDITRGRKEIWASAVVCIIARMNLLFIKENNNYISMKTILNYFETKIGAVGIRAAEIENVCKLNICNGALCDKKLFKDMVVIKLPKGKIITSAMGKKKAMVRRYI